MKQKIWIAATAFAALWLIAGAGRARADELKVGDKVDLNFISATGQHVSFQALKGKIILVDFWATWCVPCMEEAPHMVSINQKYGDKGLQIIGISLDDDKNDLLKTAAKVGFTWPQYFDPSGKDNKYSKQFGVYVGNAGTGIPNSILIGPDGTVLWRGHPGMIDKPLADAFKNDPPFLVDPAIVAAANATLDQIDANLSDHKEAAAMKLLSTVPPEASKDEKFAARLTAEQQKLSDAGSQLLAEVDPLIAQKNYPEADAKLESLCRALVGLPLATQARQKLDALLANPDARAAIDKVKREADAQNALNMALTLQKNKQDDKAYEQFKNVVKLFAGTTAATTAGAAVAEYEKDPGFVKRVNANASADKAKAALGVADSYRASGLTDKAKEKYQAIVSDYPGTRQADAARSDLDDMARE